MTIGPAISSEILAKGPQMPTQSYADANPFQIIERIVEDLISLLERENTELKSISASFTDQSTRKKLQLVSLINKVSGGIGGQTLPDKLQNRISLAVELLNENEKALKTQIQAIEEVTSTISHAIRDAESDGTYDRTQVSRSLM